MTAGAARPTTQQTGLRWPSYRARTISIALQASVAHADTSQHSCPRLMYKAVGVFSITTHAYIPLHWGVSKLEWGHGALKTEDCSITAVAFVTAMVYVDVCLQLAHRLVRNFRR